MKNIKNTVKNIFYPIFLGAWVIGFSFAQAQTTDSGRFEIQREKVNSLIDERQKRFGDFDKSLEQKTGIFGVFKTKKDMQKSMNILQSIISADNTILQETKKLIELKENEQQKSSRLAQEYETQLSAYISTLKKLQDENEKLRKQIKNQKYNGEKVYFFIFTSIILLLILLYPKLYQLLKNRKIR